ncbi:MAG: hypothetical protein LBU60_03620 [Clostridiales bacterium]|jgi:hypothetical protein|nr:hypothetical protein [Clostridiales bacterium]
MKKEQKQPVKITFGCPQCSSKREEDCKECPRCRTSLAPIQIYPVPTKLITENEARQILTAKSMYSGISRIKKGRQNVNYDEDFILGY